MPELPVLDATVAAPPGAADHYREHGHAVVRGLASRDEVAAYRPRIEAAAAAHNLERRPLDERETYGRAFLQTHNLWCVDEDVARFVLAPRFGRVAAELMGVAGVRLYHDQSLFKEPGGGRTPWHQDQFYWPFATTQTITMWMPLVDLPDEVGSMHFAAGSHRIGHVSGESISDESDREITALIAARGLAVETHGALRAGDATFHSGWTLHSAGPNPTDRMRSVMTVIYVADGTVVAPPANRFQELDRRLWLDDTPPGQPVDGPLNPLVYPSP